MDKDIISSKLKTSPAFNDAIKEEAVAAAVYEYIKKNNIQIPAGITEDIKRKLAESLDIKNENDLKIFFNDSGLTSEEFEIFINKEASLKAIKDIVITDEMAANYFREHRERFKIIHAEKYIINDIHDEEKLISTHVYNTEINPNKTSEIILRGDLQVDIESIVFNAAEGDIVGPLNEGDHYVIYKIKKIKPAVFNNLTRSKIREGLFDQWLSSLLTSIK